MSDLTITDIINEVYSGSDTGGIDTSPTTDTINQNGVTASISKVYVVGEAPTDALYSGPEYGIEAGDQIPIVYGQILLSGSIIEGAIERSDIDPERIINRFVVRIGDGENAGLGASAGDNIFMNCAPMKNDNQIGFADVVVRELVGSTAKNVIGDAIPKLIFGDQDPTTGKDVLGLKNPKKQEALTQSSDALAAGFPTAIMYYDEASCGWVAKAFVTAFQESGITAEKITVWENITQKSTDAIKFIFANAQVTDNGDRSVTITANVEGHNNGTGEPVYTGNTGEVLQFNNIKAGTNVTVTTVGNDIVISSSGGGGGGGAPSPFVACEQQIFVCFDPAPSTTYTLRRNGTTMKSYTTDSSPTRLELAVGLSSGISGTALYQVSPYSTTDEGLPLIKIAKGYDPCLPCDTATWAIYDNTGAVKCYNAPAACSSTLPPSFD